MRFDILTLFPEIFTPVLASSMLGRAADKGLLEFFVHNIRDHSENKHHTTDDYPFGGGAGMVMTPQPAIDCIEAVTAMSDIKPRRIYLSPRGKKLDPTLAQELAQEERLLLLCGHYEGIDERILTRIDECVSIGDYVLTGGELPALVLIDCVSRFVPGVLGHADSAFDESFSDGLLEYPQYTRPAAFRGMAIPEILLSGHHAKIAAWRRQEALRLTLAHRPDLLESAPLTKADRQYLASLDTADVEA